MTSEKFTTVFVATYPIQLAVVQSLLESEGIETRILDEHTVQANPLYSNAIGGIRLQVMEKDLDLANELLQKGGYPQSSSSTGSPKWVEALDWLATKTPFICRLRPELRITIIASLLVSMIVLVLFYLFTPGKSERLMANTWCLEKVVHSGMKLIPVTRSGKEVYVRMNGYCSELIFFGKKGTVWFPGFRSDAPEGSWEISGGRLRITKVDTFASVYEGEYEIEIKGRNLLLKSENSTLYCRNSRYYGYNQ